MLKYFREARRHVDRNSTYCLIDQARRISSNSYNWGNYTSTAHLLQRSESRLIGDSRVREDDLRLDADSFQSLRIDIGPQSGRLRIDRCRVANQVKGWAEARSYFSNQGSPITDNRARV